MNARMELLSRVPLFKALNTGELERLARAVIVRKYGKGDAILMEDDASANAMFVIVNGRIRVSVSGYEGREAILAIMGKGDYFGEMSVIDGEPRSASVHALAPTELMVLHREDLLSQIGKNPRVALSMLIEFSRRLRSADRRITSLALLKVYGRVADTLLDLARRQGRRAGNMIIVENRPTHQEIAELSGTTRETVSRILSRLQHSGSLIMERRRMAILDIKGLKHDDTARMD